MILITTPHCFPGHPSPSPPPPPVSWATRPGDLGGPFGVSSSAGNLSASGLGGVSQLGLRPPIRTTPTPLREHRTARLGPTTFQHLTCAALSRLPGERITAIITLLPGVGFHSCVIQHPSQQQQMASRGFDLTIPLVVQAWVLGRQARRGSWRFSAVVRSLRKLGNRSADGHVVLHPSRVLDRSLLTRRAHRSPAVKQTAPCHRRTHGPHHLERRGLEAVAPANERSQSWRPFPSQRRWRSAVERRVRIRVPAVHPDVVISAGPSKQSPSRPVCPNSRCNAVLSCCAACPVHLLGSASVVLLKAWRGRAILSPHFCPSSSSKRSTDARPYSKCKAKRRRNERSIS